MSSRPHRLSLFALGLGLLAGPVAAQELTGRVLDHASGEPLATVRVVLLDPDGRQYDETLTDSLGHFALAPPRAGSWLVAAELLGYASVRSPLVAVEAGEGIELEIRMSVEPIPVEPVVVTGRVWHSSPDLRDFYERVRRGRTTGFGSFVTRAEIDRSSPFAASDVVRMLPGVRVVRTGGGPGSGNLIRLSRGCIPAIYVDGTHINGFRPGESLDNFVVPMDIEGIEVYRGSTPPVGGYFDDRGCGLVLVWTRRGTRDGRPFSWTRLIIGASLLLGVLFLH